MRKAALASANSNIEIVVSEAELAATHRELFQWQCAFCLERQPFTHVDEAVRTYCVAVRKADKYKALCTGTTLRSGLVQPPPFVTEAMLCRETCRDCGAPGMKSNTNLFQNVERYMSLLRVLLAQDARQCRGATGDSAGCTAADFQAADAFLARRDITVRGLDGILLDEHSAIIPLWSAAEAQFPLALPPWRIPAQRLSVGLVSSPHAMEKHGALVQYAYGEDLSAAQVEEIRADQSAETAMTGKYCKPAHLPDMQPERPDRLRAACGYLVATGTWQSCVRIKSRECTIEEISLAVSTGHRRYLDEKEAELASQGDSSIDLSRVIRTGDTYWCAGTMLAARLAAGCVVSATEAVLSGQVHRSIALVRPPGHHASADCSRGFCVLNSVAVAARKAMSPPWNLSRILIVDWDIHHGDGTEALFYDDPRVLCVSVHRYDDGGFYPGTGHIASTGSGAGQGYNINVPLNGDWYGDADYAAIWDSIVLPVGRSFDPQLVLVSAGFDAARGDFLGDFDVTPSGYGHLTHGLLSLAAGKMVVALEGGYNLRAIATSTDAVARVMLGEAPTGLDGTGGGNPVKDAAMAEKGATGQTQAIGTRQLDESLASDEEKLRYHSQARVPRSSTWAAIRSVAVTHAKYWPVLAPFIVAAIPPSDNPKDASEY